jgi:hypothetical protein
MAFDELYIANRMLLRAGAPTITSLGTATKEQRLTQSVYDGIVYEVFHLTIPWKFATVHVELNEITPVPTFGWLHQFAIPPGYVRMIKTMDENSEEIHYPYRKAVLLTTALGNTIETDIFLTNQESMFVEYVYLRKNPAAWPGWFQKLVILSGAKEMVGKIKKDDFTMLQISKDLEAATIAAKGANGAEDMNVSIRHVDTDMGNQDFVDATQDPEGVDEGISPWSLNRS